MLSPFVKGAAVSALTIAICLMINGARAESYGSDAPNAGAPVASTKSKPAQVRVTPKFYVVHPQVDTSTSRKRGK